MKYPILPTVILVAGLALLAVARSKMQNAGSKAQNAESADYRFELKSEDGNLLVVTPFDGLKEGKYTVQLSLILKGGEVRGLVLDMQVGKIISGQKIASRIPIPLDIVDADDWYFARADLLHHSATESDTLVHVASIWRNSTK